MVSNIVVLQKYKVVNDLGNPYLQNWCGFDKSHVGLGIIWIKEYRTIYLKKVYPDGRKANCQFS